MQIMKMKISYDGNLFTAVSLINAELRIYEHPDSNPWKIVIETKTQLDCDKKAKIHFLTEDGKSFEASILVSLENSIENSQIRKYTLNGYDMILPSSYFN